MRVLLHTYTFANTQSREMRFAFENDNWAFQQRRNFLFIVDAKKYAAFHSREKSPPAAAYANVFI